jgi:hypothetical protein
MQGHSICCNFSFKTAVISEWIKAFRQKGGQSPLYYWQSSFGEIDLLIDYGGILHGLEIKATATPTSHHAAALSRRLELAGPTSRGSLACRVPEPQALRKGIHAVSWHLC